NETIAYQSAQAANLMWSVPVISGFLLSGSWTAMMGMASSIGAHATSGANTADIQRKQAEIDWEQKMLRDTTNSWSPTAGELTRTGIDAEMLGLSKNSQSALKEIEALGSIGAAINTAATKSAYDSLSNQAYINRMSESDMVGVGNSKAVIDQAAAGGTDEAASASGGYDKLVDIKSTSDAYDFLAKSRENMQHINMGGGLDAASQRVSDAMFADKQLAMRVTEETLGRHGGLDNFLNQASQAKSYENYMGTQKSIGTELAFESLYAQHGGGKSREGFYQYMTSENGRAELGEALGKANVASKTDNDTFINTGEQALEQKIAQTNANENAADTLNMSTQDVFNRNENFNAANTIGKTIAGEKAAAYISPFSDQTTSLIDAAVKKDSLVSYADENGAKREVGLDKEGSAGYDSTNLSKEHKENNIYENKTVTDTSYLHNKSWTNNESINQDKSVGYKGWEDQLVNDNLRDKLRTGDMKEFDILFEYKGGSDYGADNASVKGIVNITKDVAVNTVSWLDRTFSPD
ncbi:MAG: hypothetical protein PHE67_03710, partial [Campylobacterales bacterium]|nr:hypothetical protein [Campylobacterales bacterium]